MTEKVKELLDAASGGNIVQLNKLLSPETCNARDIVGSARCPFPAVVFAAVDRVFLLFYPQVCVCDVCLFMFAVYACVC